MSRPPVFRPAAFAACVALARGERVGIDAADIRPGCRKLRCGRHLVFHRAYSDDVLDIVRVLLERMDVSEAQRRG